MKFKIGDRFSKRPNAGLIVASLPLCSIPDLPENRTPQPCLQCEDLDCLEWPTCYILTGSGTPFGAVHNVSECQMDPVDQ